jgi:hypothetical protein
MVWFVVIPSGGLILREILSQIVFPLGKVGSRSIGLLLDDFLFLGCWTMKRIMFLNNLVYSIFNRWQATRRQSRLSRRLLRKVIEASSRKA